jgi:hypothetical protein
MKHGERALREQRRAEGQRVSEGIDRVELPADVLPHPLLVLWIPRQGFGCGQDREQGLPQFGRRRRPFRPASEFARDLPTESDDTGQTT